jgi:hypothetical protein
MLPISHPCSPRLALPPSLSRLYVTCKSAHIHVNRANDVAAREVQQKMTLVDLHLADLLVSLVDEVSAHAAPANPASFLWLICVLLWHTHTHTHTHTQIALFHKSVGKWQVSCPRDRYNIAKHPWYHSQDPNDPQIRRQTSGRWRGGRRLTASGSSASPSTSSELPWHSPLNEINHALLC